MNKRILIVSTVLTGHGHKSISDAIYEEIKANYPEVEVKVVDGFLAAGAVGKVMGNSYAPLIKYAPGAYYFYYKMTGNHVNFTNWFTRINLQKQFVHEVKTYKPDVIVSVHAAFVGSILDILENNNLNIPLITIVADLISFHDGWADKRTHLTICPTLEVKQRLIQLGLLEDKIKTIGLPVRKKFTINNILEQNAVESAKKNNELKILITNGSEKKSKIIRIASTLLEDKANKVTIVAGRDKKLYNSLKKHFDNKFPEQLSIYGYVDNLEKHMTANDVLIARGSPNIIMEAVHSCIPLVVIGSLKAQEEKNPDFVRNNKLGVICQEIDEISCEIKALKESNYKKLYEIKQKQLAYRNTSVTRETVDAIIKA